MMQRQRARRGFSLIEINLAIFLVAMGMLTLFSLFPKGLKQIETAHESTQEALFADYVLSAIRAKAMTLTAAEWKELAPAKFTGFTFNSLVDKYQFPAGSGLYMRYWLELGKINDHVWSVTFWCRSGEYGAKGENTFKQMAMKTYTEIFYSGMP